MKSRAVARISAAGLVLAALAAFSAPSAQAKAPEDFNGDGKSDLLWRQGSTGATVLWLMNGTSVEAAYNLGGSSDWSVVATGDFNGDGYADLIWRQASTGLNVMWLMNGAALPGALSQSNLGGSSDWSIVATGDFNGDGKTDLIWRQASTGATVLWLMNGATILHAYNLGGSSDWSVSATGDFNGDNYTDLIWRQASTGATVLWLMNGASLPSVLSITSLGGSADWSVTLTGDFNGDGKTDLVWRQASTGTTVVWFMNGASETSLVSLGGSTDWSAIGAGDFNGGDVTDIVWRQASTGTMLLWLLNGSTTIPIVAASAGLGGSSDWTFVAGSNTVSAPAAPAYFVAPTGNDSNPGTITQPYLTIQKCATTAASGSTCYIRAGTYTETVTPNSGITISSYNGESVTVDGSDAVTGWTVYQGSIYQATVTLSTGDTNQVFANGQMMTEARWPNGNDLFHVNWATLGTGTTASLLVDSSLPNINWTGAKIHFWSGTDPADHQTGTVTSSAAGQLNLTLDGIGNPFYTVPQPGGYYYLYRLFAALDAPNEWFYDSTKNTLYFWAPGGVDPNTLLVRAKQRPYAFDLSGKSNVTIEYIHLFASTINSNSSSTGNTINGINAQYLSQFTDLPDNPPAGVEATDTYYTLHQWDTGIILYGTSNVVENSVIEWSAGNGVAVAGSGNTVKNNLIDHVDYMGIDTAGVNVAGMNQEVQNNTIYATGRYGIWLNSWYYGTESGLPNGVNVEVSYNNIYSTMILSADAGAIYTGETEGVTGSAIHHNWVHDSQSLYSMVLNKSPQYPLPGVYLDQYATGWNVYQNVLWNNQLANIYLYETGMGTASEFPPQDDLIYNNSIPDVASTGYIWLAGILNCGTTQITNNLVLVPVLQNDAVIPSSCPATNNTATAPGANEMTSTVQVGCNFSGCASAGPPAISGSSVASSIAVQPYGVTVPAGQTATFSVIGAGSAPLTYQWQKNGANISGATATTYTTPATSAMDSGAVFTVQVTNSLGTVKSNAAVLTVD